MIAVLILGSVASGQGRLITQDKFDRLSTLERFLQTVYPRVYDSSSSAVLTVQTVEFPTEQPGRRSWDTLFFSLVRCRASGVVGGPPPHAPTLPGCGTVMHGQEALGSQLLRGSITLRSGRFRVESFLAAGDLVAPQLERFEAEMSKHLDWTDERVVQVLREKGPGFPPENAGSLAKQVDVATIYQFTGCRLQPDKARLLVDRYKGPPEKVATRWFIPGTLRGDKYRTVCRAEFDPFTGQLLTIM